MDIYRIAQDSIGDVGCFLLCRKDGRLMWEWIGFEAEVNSNAPKLDRIINTDTYTVGEKYCLFTPFLESDL